MTNLEIHIGDQREELEQALEALPNQGVARKLAAEMEARFPNVKIGLNGFKFQRLSLWVVGLQEQDRLTLGVASRWNPQSGSVMFLPMRTCGHNDLEYKPLDPEQRIKWDNPPSEEIN